VVAILLLAVELPWPLRLLGCLAQACTFPALRRFTGVSGEAAVWAVEWRDGGDQFVRLGAGGMRRLPFATQDLREFGRAVWVLSFSTREGVISRAFCPLSQDAPALRRFLRRRVPGRDGPIRAPAGE
jgi:hypothetical protein